MAYLSTVTVASIKSTIRGVPSEVVLDEADVMKTTCASEPAQRGHSLAATFGEAGGQVEQCPDGQDLHVVAFFNRLRCQLMT
jgi:hypothetical protein